MKKDAQRGVRSVAVVFVAAGIAPAVAAQADPIWRCNKRYDFLATFAGGGSRQG